MNAEKHVLHLVWDDYRREMGAELRTAKKIPYQRIIADLLSVGEFYYYTLNIGDSSINNFHENILRLHGLTSYPQHLSEIIALIHPEDIPFVIEAERQAIDKLREIGWEHKMNLKSSYCFRMITGDGTYQLFHHQALTIREDEGTKMVEAINIHTNIQHITPTNSYTVLISGISPRTDFHQIKLKPDVGITPKTSQNLTKRETEILKLIAQGHSSQEIANLLFLSTLTVRTHRKNILRKTQAKNGSDLVKRCIEWGLI